MSEYPMICVKFASPDDDPLKVPRPLFLTVNADLSVSQRGGEFGFGQLIGLCADENGEIADFGDAEQWCDVSDLVADGVDKFVSGQVRAAVPACEGWWPCVIDQTGMYTVGYRVEAVEVRDA